MVNHQVNKIGMLVYQNEGKSSQKEKEQDQDY